MAGVFLQGVYMGMGCTWTTGSSFSRRLPYTNSCRKTDRQGELLQEYFIRALSVVRIMRRGKEYSKMEYTCFPSV
jgi:hypothetical protein